MLKSLFASVLTIGLGVVAFSEQTQGFKVYTNEAKRRLDIQQAPVDVLPVEFEMASHVQSDWQQLGNSFLIVDFIYTNCETVCHALGYEFARLQREASDLVDSGRLGFLSVSFDAENDKPEALQEYVARFGGDANSWYAARVTQQRDLRELMKQFGVVAIKDEQGGYVHNAALHLVSPDKKLVRIVDYQEAEQLLQTIRSGEADFDNAFVNVE